MAVTAMIAGHGVARAKGATDTRGYRLLPDGLVHRTRHRATHEQAVERLLEQAYAEHRPQKIDARLHQINRSLPAGDWH
jgi:hypothetical protein